MDAQGADSVPQALRYTPGILSEANGYDIRYDWLNIRGFSTYGTIWMDGLALPGDPSSYATPSVNPYALERIEVIKGPASVLYGRTMPGGLVNYVSKRPQPTARNEVVIGTFFIALSASGATCTPRSIRNAIDPSCWRPV